ncbi:hypothetical protein Taro_022523 [Colocasia esculenta]|uniref:Uncharacterized protein n=1 Tax=Colocasia esculenta TaxID=4460 RepID=A0A843V406_COLES|nr:hypothetical protein [Colocasia esculenta]
MSSLLSPESFNVDLGQQWIEFLSKTLISFEPRREAFLIKRARCLDDVWTAMSSAARELGLCVSTMVPRPPQSLLEGLSSHNMEVPAHVESPEACAGSVPETTGSPGGAEPVESLLSSLQSIDQDNALLPSVPETHEELSKDDDIDDWDYELDVTDIPILDPNWDLSMENPDDPCFSIPFDDLMEMMRDPLSAINKEVPQATTIVVKSIAADATPSLPVEGKNELPMPSPLLLDSSVPHEETGIPDRPLSQPSEPAMTSQGDPSPKPTLRVTTNDEGGSFAPLPPALDLPTASTEAEVLAKPSECLSGLLYIFIMIMTFPPHGLLDAENSGATSPLPASEPDSSETCVISGLDRSSRALEVLGARLAALRSEPIDTAGQISMVRGQHTSLLSTQRKRSARATLLRMWGDTTEI